MKASLHNRRYSIFLLSFILMLFGDIFFTAKNNYNAQTILILQNMLLSLLLFYKKSAWHIRIVSILLVLGLFARIYYQFNPEFTGYPFLIIYTGYFLLVSYRAILDLLFEKEVGIEMISAAFSGYMLLGTLFSLLFIAMGTSGAFKGPGAFVASSDYLYFSFVTLLTIGYGDIVPVTEIAKKLIVLLGLMGNFYSVFVVGIVIGKYLNKYR